MKAFLIRTALSLLVVSVSGMRAQPKPLTVCQAMDRLSELNGREVSIRGTWMIGDTGETLWASPACKGPIVRDGWIWQSVIGVKPDDMSRLRPVYEQYTRLEDNHESIEILATLTGVLQTKDHFKFDRGPGLPWGYNGYWVASLVFSKAADLEALPVDASERARYDSLAQKPWPVKVKRGQK